MGKKKFKGTPLGPTKDSPGPKPSGPASPGNSATPQRGPGAPMPPDDDLDDLPQYMRDMTIEERQSELERIEKRAKAAKQGAATAKRKAQKRQEEQHKHVRQMWRYDNLLYGSAKGAKTGEVLDWSSWDSYEGEWDHLGAWDEAAREFVIFKEVGNANDYSTFQIKCKLCRNAKNKPAHFSWEHSETTEHKQRVREREAVVGLLRDVCLEVPAQIRRFPVPTEPWLVLVPVEDYQLCCTRLYARCMVCGPNCDQEFPGDMAQVVSHRLDGPKNHLKGIWGWRFPHSPGAAQCRAQVEAEKKRLFSEDRVFFDDDHGDEE